MVCWVFPSTRIFARQTPLETGMPRKTFSPLCTGSATAAIKPKRPLLERNLTLIGTGVLARELRMGKVTKRKRTGEDARATIRGAPTSRWQGGRQQASETLALPEKKPAVRRALKLWTSRGAEAQRRRMDFI